MFSLTIASLQQRLIDLNGVFSYQLTVGDRYLLDRIVNEWITDVYKSEDFVNVEEFREALRQLLRNGSPDEAYSNSPELLPIETYRGPVYQ